MNFLGKYWPYWPASAMMLLILVLIAIKPFVFQNPRVRLHMTVETTTLAEPIQFKPCPHCGEPEPQWSLPAATCSKCGTVNQPLKKSLDSLLKEAP